MFEDLFIDRGTIARYRSAPLLNERLSYLTHCAQVGLTAGHVAQHRGLSDQTGSPSRLA